MEKKHIIIRDKPIGKYLLTIHRLLKEGNIVEIRSSMNFGDKFKEVREFFEMLNVNVGTIERGKLEEYNTDIIVCTIQANPPPYNFDKMFSAEIEKFEVRE